MIVAIMVTPADVTDRDAAREVLLRLCLEHPEITQVWADQGYSGELVTWARNTLGLLLRISKKPPGQVEFKVLPRRWIVERSLSWITQARRLVRDYERLPRHSEALVNWTAITLMTRRLARQVSQSNRLCLPLRAGVLIPLPHQSAGFLGIEEFQTTESMHPQHLIQALQLLREHR